MQRPTVIPSDEATDPTALQVRTIHGYRRAFRMCGEGPVLVLLHGIGDSSDGWRDVMLPLAEHFTVVAPDLLGHGASDKPRADYSVAAYANGVRDLMDVLGIDTATIVGHSLGGGVAAQTTYQYPHRVERLVLVATGGVSREVTPSSGCCRRPSPSWPSSRSGCRAPTVQPGRRRRAPGVGHRPRSRDADELLRVFDNLPPGLGPDLVHPHPALRRRLAGAGRDDARPLLPRRRHAHAPGAGDRDPALPFAHAHLAHRAMPASRLEVFEGAGHFPHHADPDRFVEVMVDFVASTAPARFDRRRWTRILRSGRRPGLIGIDDRRAPGEDEGAIVG